MKITLAEGTKKGNSAQEILNGTYVVDLTMNKDERGSVTEIYRKNWSGRLAPQWNHTVSEANVMRGAHVHFKRNEHLILADGELIVGLRDIRPGSPTFGHSRMLTLSAKKLQMIYMPTGILHALYAVSRCVFLVGQTAYYERADEIDCFYNDPALDFKWPDVDPIMTERDRNAPPLSSILKLVPAWQPQNAFSPHRALAAAL
jgi:dTDP-4-dehydrorhamnose 3,5-epimerase